MGSIANRLRMNGRPYGTIRRDGDLESSLRAVVPAVVAIAALYFAKEVLLPLALAILLSFLLAPLVTRLEKWGSRRIPAVLVVVAVAFSGSRWAWVPPGLPDLRHCISTSRVQRQHSCQGRIISERWRWSRQPRERGVGRRQEEDHPQRWPGCFRRNNRRLVSRQ